MLRLDHERPFNLCIDIKLVNTCGKPTKDRYKASKDNRRPEGLDLFISGLTEIIRASKLGSCQRLRWDHDSQILSSIQEDTESTTLTLPTHHLVLGTPLDTFEHTTTDRL